MLEDPVVLVRVESCHEGGSVVEVELSVSDTDACRRHLLVPDLGHTPHQLREEGLRQKHVDEVGLNVVGCGLFRSCRVPRDSTAVLVVCHGSSLPV